MNRVVRYVLVVFRDDKLPSFHTFDTCDEAHQYRLKHYPRDPNHISMCLSWPSPSLKRGKHQVARFYRRAGMSHELYLTIFPVEMSE